MKKLMLISLLAVPFCKAAAANDYYKAAQEAAEHWQWQDLYKLIDEDKVDVNEVPDKNKDTLFINYAVRYGQLEVAQELLDRGTNLNTEEVSITPLQKASDIYLMFRENMPMIQLLLENGANPNAKNSSGETTFDFIKNTRYDLKAKQKLIDLLQSQQSACGMYIKGD